MNNDKPCMRDKGLTVDFLERTSAFLKVIAHPHRLKIIEIIEREGEVNVSSIIEEIQLPQSSVSLHLNQMKRMGLLNSERNGKEVIYKIKDPRVLRILECVCKGYHGECNK